MNKYFLLMKNKGKNQKVFFKEAYPRGFTLIETFVAITILLITVLGPMSLMSNALKNSRYIKDEIIATHLAQEGVELMIDQRNNNEAIFPSPSNCLHGANLKFHQDLGYQCDDGDETIFNRVIGFEQIANEIEDSSFSQYKITSTVTRSNFPGKDIVSKSIILK